MDMTVRSQSHEHVFPLDEVDAEFDGKYVYVQQFCEEAPLVASVTDHVRDETYDIHGEPCEATRTTSVRVHDPIHTESGREVEYDGDGDSTWQKVMNGHADEIKETVIEEFVRSSAQATTLIVEEDGSDYCIPMEFDGVEVSQ